MTAVETITDRQREILHALRHGRKEPTGRVAFAIQAHPNTTAAELAALEGRGLVSRTSLPGRSPVTWMIRPAGFRVLAGGGGDS